MQNIQDLKDKIFFESKNIIDILGGINNVDELISKHDLLNDLVEKIAFLKLLDKNLGDYKRENANFSVFQQDESLVSNYLVTEEEAIFNNELNEIGNESFSEAETKFEVEEEEAIFNNQLNEIIENDFYENIVNLAEENQPEANENFVSDEISDHLDLEEEAVFNNQLNEIDEEPENPDYVLSFVDEERILENSQPESDDDFNEETFNEEATQEEVVFTNQLNEIIEEESSNSENESDKNHILTDVFETENNEDEILIEETEYTSTFNHENDEIISESSNVESILSEIKKDIDVSEEEESESKAEDSDRRKIVDIDKPQSDKVTEVPKSDESFENLDDYHQKQKIKLANIRGLKSIQTLFDDDPLERETPHEKVEIPVVKEDTGSLIKTNIPTQFMEAEKPRPEFKLDLNDRIAFTKVLFNGSQTDLNDSISELNRCRNIEEAKEFLSELYYDKNWEKVDEYAQRLWVLVENKFL
ncbi:hypothetical protein NAL32_15725 [Chryseobacterium sp. Ch-15]|uniref:Uncharacterized protein n=1 Tax=Chryseobacterium muglaense TaxID=2893752 RepID=A0A9Q3UVN4_9FLAO|nr:hypothetical protein [Chryseobacterium muglaense]MBD3906034.1 hypothetical protein [Chryseobacterium muglaense]MCC9035232.1 hypothetical protein [Chryseobacterium muglaense]MCM2555833.1 hypothetical protein [Chryseobacterium muglaense]